MKSPALVVILLPTSVAGFAQTEGARISGRVTDASDAVVVGAQCAITNISISTTTLRMEFMSELISVRPPTG